MIESKNSRKLSYLESIGVEIHDYNINDSPEDSVSFSSIEGDFEILFDDFDIEDSLYNIQLTADQYSCCGDILDKDYMLCPTCLEHC